MYWRTFVINCLATANINFKNLTVYNAFVLRSNTIFVIFAILVLQFAAAVLKRRCKLLCFYINLKVTPNISKRHVVNLF